MDTMEDKKDIIDKKKADINENYKNMQEYFNVSIIFFNFFNS